MNLHYEEMKEFWDKKDPEFIKDKAEFYKKETPNIINELWAVSGLLGHQNNAAVNYAIDALIVLGKVIETEKHD